LQYFCCMDASAIELVFLSLWTGQAKADKFPVVYQLCSVNVTF
jgi:hypothetical protein